MYTVERLGPKFAIDALENEAFKSVREKSGGLLSFEKERSRFPRNTKVEYDEDEDDDSEDDDYKDDDYSEDDTSLNPMRCPGVGCSLSKGKKQPEEQPEEQSFNILDMGRRKKQQVSESISVDDLLR